MQLKNNHPKLNKTLRISEIFYSIQGESNSVGFPTLFIRLTGCPLRCLYCDTAYAFKGGVIKSIDEILTTVSSYDPLYITVTGGEPLAQPNCLYLLSLLCDQNYVVSLETSGALDISKVDQRVIKVLDLKTPGSGESSKNLYSNLQYLTSKDQIKFVICSQEDYQWAKEIIYKYSLLDLCQILFSPSYEQYSIKQLAENILADKLTKVRLQSQLHKYIWGDISGV